MPDAAVTRFHEWKAVPSNHQLTVLPRGWRLSTPEDRQNPKFVPAIGTVAGAVRQLSVFDEIDRVVALVQELAHDGDEIVALTPITVVPFETKAGLQLTVYADVVIKRGDEWVAMPSSRASGPKLVPAEAAT